MKDEDIELTGEIEENILPPENIVVLNELRSASDLNRLMLSNDSIDIQPGFQRDEVWSLEMRTRFIDSLAKEFPIPSMCFALDPKEQKFIVIDGLQRMSTIRKFLNDSNWVLSKLNDVDERISGKSVNEIKLNTPEIFRRIENVSLPVTVLRYNPKRKDNMEYIFTIFQRLNTFGDHLNNQEIRNAIYQGPFNSFIRECAKDPIWTSFANVQAKGKNKRKIADERILRFFAFNDNLRNYTGKLNKFLDDYMYDNRFNDDYHDKETIFRFVVRKISDIGIERIKKNSLTIREAILYGIAKNMNTLTEKSSAELNALVDNLIKDENFSVEALSGGIMQKNKVQKRLTAAKRIFS